MKVIILAAGIGSRLRPLTESVPKALLPVGQHSILEHQMRNFKVCGIQDIVVVTGHETQRVRSFLGDRAKTVFNPIFDRSDTLFSLWCAREYLLEDFIYIHGDVLFHPEILRRLLNSEGSVLCAIEKRSGLGNEEEKVMVDGERILSISKLNPSEKSCGESLGLVFFRRGTGEKFLKIIEQCLIEGALQAHASEGLNRLIEQGEKVSAVLSNPYGWIEIDFYDDYRLALERYALGDFGLQE